MEQSSRYTNIFSAVVAAVGNCWQPAKVLPERTVAKSTEKLKLAAG